MPNIQLLHDPTCPHLSEARVRLRQACERAGVDPRWSEHPRDHEGHAPPTILVDGSDVFEAAQSLPECCRVPAAGNGLPEITVIAHAIVTADQRAPANGRARWSTTAAVMPGVLAALLPRITCPACWPAYAGFLGAVGLPILMDVRWLLPLTGASLLVAVGALAVGARSRRGYAPLLVGLAASALVLIGKFVFGSNPATYLGTAMLVCASVWNAWPTSTAVACRQASKVTQ